MMRNEAALKTAASKPTGWILRDLVRGVAAGLAGTAAMSLSQSAEIAATGRKPSATPAEAACVLLGIETRTEAQEQRFAREAHWAYGTLWGLGQIPLRRMPEPYRSLMYFAAAWGAGAVLLTRLKLAPPPTDWKTSSLLSDLGHHAVYTGASNLVFDLLDRSLPTSSAADRLRSGSEA
ncbi:MAG: hypothetical protein AB7O13_03385 [Alphaproteobacteria bacterium]